LIEVILEELRKHHSKVVQILQCCLVYISQENIAYRINDSAVEIVYELSSDQEEADTKVILHSRHTLNETESVNYGLLTHIS